VGGAAASHRSLLLPRLISLQQGLYPLDDVGRFCLQIGHGDLLQEGGPTTHTPRQTNAAPTHEKL
jgi:hypothetical protein